MSQKATQTEAAAPAGPMWAVVVSKPHAEKVAKENLENQGFEVYLPLAWTATRDKDGRTKQWIRPFFPRYMFVRINPSIDRWRSIFNTRGVDKMFVSGDRPCLVSDKDVQRVRGREECGFIKIMDPGSVTCHFETGQKVLVRGKSADLEASFIEPVDTNRALILFNFLGREHRQTVALISLR